MKPRIAYETNFGCAYCGDSLLLARRVKTGSVPLVLTSPPYPLIRKKGYGNVEVHEYLDWLDPFLQEIHRILADDGSFVLNLGGVWEKGVPVRSIYMFEVVVHCVKKLGFYFAQDNVWYNPAAMPVPAEWVTIRRCRNKVSFEYVFWLSKTPHPKADNRRVLKPYGKDMKKVLARDGMFKDSKAPSGHKKSIESAKDKGGAIPPNAILAEELDEEHENFLQWSNTDSRSAYFRRCREAGVKPHPARFPAQLPEFFIKLCTDEDDMVFDPFAGSNTTGRAAETLRRRWASCELRPDYVEASKFRFEPEEMLEL